MVRGMSQTIQKSSPIFSVEVHVHYDRDFTAQLLSFIQSLGYASFLVEEPCGMRMDCRNILALPRKSAIARDTQLSHTLTIALRSRTLVRVDNRSIFDQAYPCCVDGGACCLGIRDKRTGTMMPRPEWKGGSVSSRRGCCEWRQVRSHLSGTMPRQAWINNGSGNQLRVHPWLAHSQPWDSYG